MAVKTILIGLDGATFALLDPLMDDGVMPFLGRFVRQGVRADLRSIVPALTPPAWTSLVTGCSPGRHGVFDFFAKETPNDHFLHMVTSADVQAASVWQIANGYGLRCAALNFPITFPAPPLDGYVIAGWMPWRQLRLGCHPAGFYDRIRTLPGFDPRELAMDMAHEEKALEGCPPQEYEEWIDWHIHREERWRQILDLLLAEEEPCALVSVVFDGVDKLQHLFWRYLEPSYAATLSSDGERRIRERCLSYFRQLDTILQHLVEGVGLEATVVLASDHGFGAQERTFYANAWLARQGYLAWNENRQPLSNERQKLGIGQIAKHSYQLDWPRTRAYAPLPSGNGIHIVHADAAHPQGVAQAEYDSFCQELAAQLLAIRDPASGLAVVSQVWRKHEIFAGVKEAVAPDLTLVLADGGLLSILPSNTVVEPRPQVTGTHRAQGIFVARGPSIRQGVRPAELSILDVAPLLLYSLGLPVPNHFEGRLPVEVIRPQWLATNPLRRSEGGVQAVHPRAADAGAAEAEAALLNRLRALGYLQ